MDTVLARFWNQITTYFGLSGIKITLVDIVEVFIVAFLIYYLMAWIKNTRAWNLFKGIVVILLFVLMAAIFQMNTILWLAENLLNVGLIALVIIFQPELRRLLERVGQTRLGNLQSGGDDAEAIAAAS